MDIVANIVKRDITFSDLFKSTNLEYLHGFYVLKKSVFLNCIPIENELATPENTITYHNAF